jgi:hypothetical protein
MKKIISHRQLVVLTIILFSVMSTTILSCEKAQEDKCEDSQEGILKNFAGLDGCGWIIQLSDSVNLEPINLDEFEIELEENKKVCIQYHERTDLASVCMVGKIVEIDFIE